MSSTMWHACGISGKLASRPGAACRTMLAELNLILRSPPRLSQARVSVTPLTLSSSSLVLSLGSLMVVFPEELMMSSADDRN
jgi:hypothetical protein